MVLLYGRYRVILENIIYIILGFFIVFGFLRFLFVLRFRLIFFRRFRVKYWGVGVIKLDILGICGYFWVLLSWWYWRGGNM